ncbi:hypothetical protein PHYC_02974 [Phycisphaerales bacterium]|nr:hypothetical protein PHYC_02974 [Phycisphaerales bacterium]
MVMTTVTIELDDELMARVIRLATARQVTVQEMVQRLLRVIAAPELKRTDLPPVTQQALGMLPALSDEQVSSVLEDERKRRFGAE